MLLEQQLRTDMSLNETFPGAAPRVLLCGMVAVRDPIEFLQSIGVRDFGLVVATEPDSSRAMPAANLADAASTLGVSAVSIPLPARAPPPPCPPPPCPPPAETAWS
jgi:hypothetical protein